MTPEQHAIEEREERKELDYLVRVLGNDSAQYCATYGHLPRLIEINNEISNSRYEFHEEESSR